MISPVVRKITYSACLILLFALVVPAWNGAAKAESLKPRPATTLADPVFRVIANTRKLLLSRVEANRTKEKVAFLNTSSSSSFVVNLR